MRVGDKIAPLHHPIFKPANLPDFLAVARKEGLMGHIKEKIADGRVLELVEQMLQAGVMESAKGWQPTDKGTPQGAVVSPLLSNIYLDGLDWKMAENGIEMVRYADDFILLCRSQQEAQEAMEQVQRWVEENGLQLHPTKTRLVNASLAGGFDFLGYHFERGMKWPRKKSMDKLKERIRQKTRRTDGRSMRTICEDLSRTLRGGFGYFKHGKANVFESVDAYVRGRLRRILRKRNKKKGRGRGSDHQRWPNAYFTPMGLYSLKQAHAVVCRSF